MTPFDLPSDSNEVVIEYESECNFIEELHRCPENWKDIFTAIIHYANDDALAATIAFMNAYIDKYGAENISVDCRDAIEQLIWFTPTEYRLRIQDLRRRF